MWERVRAFLRGTLGPSVLGSPAPTTEYKVLLRRDGNSWRAGVPSILPGWWSGKGEIQVVAAAARAASSEPDLKLKVKPGTALTAEDVLDLVEANQGSWRLDISFCDMMEIDLGPSVIEQKWLSSVMDTAVVPPWVFRPAAGHTSGVNLYGANLQHANMEHADLRGACLEETDLRQVAFSSAKMQAASLARARLQGAEFIGTDLTGADLSQAILEGVNLSQTTSLAAVHWSGAYLNRTLITPQQLDRAIGDEPGRGSAASAYRKASEAYRLLKNNFNSLDDYSGSRLSFMREQEMRGMMHKAAWRSSWSWGEFGRWSWNRTIKGLSGYGEEPLRPLIWAFGVVLLYTLVYWTVGYVKVASDSAIVQTKASGSLSALDALIYSAATFCTLSFSSMEPTCWATRLVAVSEAACGTGLFALLIWTLGNRISRS